MNEQIIAKAIEEFTAIITDAVNNNYSAGVYNSPMLDDGKVIHVVFDIK